MMAAAAVAAGGVTASARSLAAETLSAAEALGRMTAAERLVAVAAAEVPVAAVAFRRVPAAKQMETARARGLGRGRGKRPARNKPGRPLTKFAAGKPR